MSTRPRLSLIATPTVGLVVGLALGAGSVARGRTRYPTSGEVVLITRRPTGLGAGTGGERRAQPRDDPTAVGGN